MQLPYLAAAALLLAFGALADAPTRLVVFGGQGEQALRQRALMEEIAGGLLGRPDDYSARATVTFKTQPRPLWDHTDLPIGASERPLEGSGWHAERDVFAWMGDGGPRGVPLDISLATPTPGVPAAATDYDELWAEVLPVAFAPACAVQVELGLEMRGRGGRDSPVPVVARSGAQFSPRVVASLDPSRAAWVPKDFTYVAGRILGLAADEDWRYSNAGSQAVMQRRIRLPLDGIEAVDVSLAAGVAAHQVNLRVGKASAFSRDEVLEFPLTGASALPDGRPGVRLQTRQMLQQRLAESATSFADWEIHEIVIFIPGEARATVNAAPLRRIAFVAAETAWPPPPARAQNITLPSTLVSFADRRHRLVVDLRPLKSRGDAVIRRAALQLVGSGATECAVRPSAVRLVKAYTDNAPRFAAHVEEVARRWGDVQGGTLRGRGRVAYPRIVAHLPISAMTGIESPPQTAEYLLRLESNREAKLARVRPIGEEPAYRVRHANSREVGVDPAQLVASNGAVATFDGPLPQVTANDNMATWYGHFRAFEILLPVDDAIADSAWFYFSVPSGAEHISTLTLALESSDGRRIVRSVTPNTPLFIPVAAARIRAARLRGVMAPATEAVKLRLDSMTIFQPSDMSYEDAFSATLPTPVSAIPEAVLSSGKTATTRIQPGRISGLLGGASSGELRFTTTLDPPLRWLRGIKLRYRLPSALLDADPCVLGFAIGSAADGRSWKVCLNRSSGDIFLPFAALSGVAVHDIGTVRTIEWTLKTSTVSPVTQRDGFDLAYEIEGWAMASAADELRTAPLLDSGRTIIHATSPVPAMQPKGYLAPMSIPLDPAAIWEAARSGEQIRARSSDSFSVAEVTLESRTAIADARPPGPRMTVSDATPRWPKVLVALAIAALAWAAWTQRTRWRRWAAVSAGAATYAGTRALRTASSLGARRLARASASVAAVAAAAGVWASGRLGWDFPGAMLLLAVALMSMGALLHWHRFHFPQDPSRFSTVLVVSAALAAGCVAWALGRYGVSPTAAWAILPALAALCVAAPSWMPHAVPAARRLRRAIAPIFWVAVALALYGYGAISPRPRENYFFTVAGIAVVLAWRAVALAVEPRARALFPFAAERVYSAAGGIYLLGALVALLLAGVALVLGRQVLLEQIATVLYYLMVVALVRLALALRRDAAGS